LSLTLTPGIYGKLQSHGDFVSRRLPQGFVGPWDEWLQDGIAQSRNVLESAWAEVYEEAPVWRFLLPGGVCGDEAWAGIVQPSVDRVGRYFPLTIAAPLPPELDIVATFVAAGPWYEAIEREAAAAFDESPSLDELDDALGKLAFPADFLAPPAVSDDDTLPLGERVFSVIKIALATGSSLDAVKTALGMEQVAIRPWDCLWCNGGTHRIAPALLVTKALPDKKHFCAFLDGRWEEHGWESGARMAAAPSE